MKNVLIASTFVRLKCDKFVKYAKDLPTVSSRILLSGPAGTDTLFWLSLLFSYITIILYCKSGDIL